MRNEQNRKEIQTGHDSLTAEPPKDRRSRVGKHVFNCVFAAILLATVAFFAITLIADLIFNTAVYADSEGGLAGFGRAAAPYLWIAVGIIVTMVELEIYHDLKYFIFNRHKWTSERTSANVLSAIFVSVMLLSLPISGWVSFFGFLSWLITRIMGGVICGTGEKENSTTH